MRGLHAPFKTRSKHDWWLVVLLGMLTALGAFALDTYLPALPSLATDFHTSASTAQLTLTACLVGLGLGQLVSGPLSDIYGRRVPLLAGIVLYVVTSVLCILAPSVYALIGLRVVQGAAASTGAVIARAIIRDVFEGDQGARVFSRVILVLSVSPILAPVIGAQVLRITTWRGVFVVLTGIGLAILAAVSVSLPETLAAEHRHQGGLGETRRALRELARDRRFLGFTLTASLALASIFAYLAGSSFVVEDVYGGSPQLFSLLFGLNGLGLVVGSQTNAYLVGRVPVERLLLAGLVVQAFAGVALLAVVTVGGLGLMGFVPPLFVLITAVGFVGPNVFALAMADQGHVAGGASAILGVAQFAVGALVAPLVGVAGKETAVPFGILIATMTLLAPLPMLALTRRPVLAPALRGA